MASLPVFNRSGQEVGKYDIDTAVLAPEINKQLLHDVCVMYQSNKRLGTAKTKSRAEVAGSTKKMYRQKGTGNARAGSRRSPVRLGGGHTFAKRPRDWYFRLPKKAIQLATRMALAAKIQSNQVVVIDELKFAAPKTKEMQGILKALKSDGASLLLVTAGIDRGVFLSARNIDQVSVLPASDLNALSIIQPRKVLLTKAALDAIKEKAAGTKKSAGAQKAAAAK
jgi:large subunit ribosomal protein L4